MKLKIFLIFLAILAIFSSPMYGQQIKVGLLEYGGIHSNKPETVAVKAFLDNNPYFISSLLQSEDISSSEVLNDLDVLWVHHRDTLFDFDDIHLTELIIQYLEGGGKLLLTQEGVRFLTKLGIEPIEPEIRYKKAVDEGYGRKLGLHSFISHPVFKELHGGAYILAPLKDTIIRQIGYFGDNLPLNGEVIAVDWDYIFLRENAKLMTEHLVRKGKVISIGAYVCLSCQNRNHSHLEQFLTNTLKYLKNGNDTTPVHFWEYYPKAVIPFEHTYPDFVEREPKPWMIDRNKTVLTRKATNNFWDIAGEQILIMGKEKSGIDEIWAHPFMAFRDYETGIILPGHDTVNWLNNLNPVIEVRPGSFTRKYNFDGNILEETIIASPDKALANIHYKYNGFQEVKLFIRFKSNLRFMWPYSENVLRTLQHTYSIELNSIIITDETQDISFMIGSNKEPDYVVTGQFGDFDIHLISDNENKYTEIKEISTDDFIVSGLFEFSMIPSDEFDMIISANYQNETQAESGLNIAVNNYLQAQDKPFNIYVESMQHYEDLIASSLIISTPDTTFNEGYLWSLIATDRFFVNTPGLGSSLVAGYSTTNSGWDGGHKVNGRPGYGWYFGRDGQWSGFALLDYGAFDKVKSILEMYQHFQNINGKIYHEISTSGVVHYDAADATPLYLILAGKYLHHTADTAFIRESWPHIKKALDYCFSTDTNGDHLIENTNVGHGWVEGGSLFGTRSSMYLSSCWAEALNQAAYICTTLRDKANANHYLTEAESVTHILNSEFWNNETHFLNQGKYQNGSFHTEASLLSVVPIYFGQIADSNAQLTLTEIASNSYSTDWGCRLINRASDKYNPGGYHTGSVWPLFTGWAALAEYKQGRHIQGYSHIMSNLKVYQDWGLGFVEEVLHGEEYKPIGVCPHQCWSETMVLQPVIEGMLGLKTDALKNILSLSPAFPADWDWVGIKNIKTGDHQVHLSITKTENRIIYEFDHYGPCPIKLYFDPVFPKGTLIRQIKLSGEMEEVKLNTKVPVAAYIKGITKLEYTLENGIEVLPLILDPKPEDESKDFRIIDDQLMDNEYQISMQGKSGSSINIFIYAKDWEIKKTKNATIIGKEGDIYEIQVKLKDTGENYSEQIITLQLN